LFLLGLFHNTIHKILDEGERMSKKICKFLILLTMLGLACSSPMAPMEPDIITAIQNQVQTTLAGNQKVESVTILEKDEKPSYDDLEQPGSQNPYWTVKSQLEIKTTVAKKKFPLFKKKYESYTKSEELKYKIWQNSEKVWMATAY